MKKKQPKETTLSILKDIKKILTRIEKGINTQAVDAINVPSQDIKIAGNTITVEFPQLTAKEMIEQCGNKIGNDKVLYSYPDGWYSDEAFYTSEKPRKGTITVTLELLHKGKSWNECNDIAQKEGITMLNFPEIVYLLINSPAFRKMLEGLNYTWSSSRSARGYLVHIGKCGVGGVLVGGWHPRRSDSGLGVCFSHSASNLKP